ncbi:MAG: molybdopterin synthase catalytic subunit MoaE [Halieaceae bacterium]|nr:molybdopterin synthase catalytic subunit MoaE [Halieaceae bacterium]
MDVSIQQEDFDVGRLQRELLGEDTRVGGTAVFVGCVRGEPDAAAADPDAVLAMDLEHYPGMTESSIQAIVDEARQRWALRSVRVIHRIGKLKPGDQIVYVGVACGHRGEAFEACEFIMDYLKTRAPFWKKETTPSGSRWVDARDSDDAAAARWQRTTETAGD